MIEYDNYICEANIGDIYDLEEFDGMVDEWGLIQCVDGNIGVDYNLCVESVGGELIHESAFYRMEYNEDTGYWDTDYDDFVPYDIDFTDAMWEEKVKRFAIGLVRSLSTNGHF